MSCCPESAAPYLAPSYEAKGEFGEADGVKYYRAGGPSQRGLLLLPDVWGWNSGRIRAIADDFSKKGLSVYVPKVLDAFEGGTDDDALPPDFDLATRGSELGPLLKGAWNVDVVLPKTLKVVEAMKAAGVKKFGVIGFCYGAWLGMHLSKQVPGTELVCAATPHPSAHIEGMMGGDPAALAAKCQCPWALFPAGKADAGGDSDMYDPEGALFKALEGAMPGKNMSKRFEDVTHGFTTRGDSGADAVRRAVVECMELTAEFFVRHGLMTKAAAGDAEEGAAEEPAAKEAKTE